MAPRKFNHPDLGTLEQWLSACESASIFFDSGQNAWIASLRRLVGKKIGLGAKAPISERQAEILESLYQDAVRAMESSSPKCDAPEVAPQNFERPERRRRPRVEASPLPTYFAPRASSLRGSDKQRSLGYKVRSFLLETIVPYMRNLKEAGDLETAQQLDALLVEVSRQDRSAWFIERRAALWAPMPSGSAALRRALHFATLTPADEAAREFAQRIARELSIKLDVAPACDCVPSPSHCPDRRRWDIIGSPHGAWLRIHVGEDQTFKYARLETGRRSEPQLHADIRYDGGCWYWLDCAGCEVVGLEAIREALANGELPE